MAETVVLTVEGMTCQGCAHSLASSLKRERGVLDVRVDWRSGRVVVTYDPQKTGPERILASPAFQGPFRARLEGDQGRRDDGHGARQGQEIL